MGFVTVMTIPLLILYFEYSSSARDSVATSQALQIARKIVDSAESVYYLGQPSQTTLKLNFPDGIYSANLSSKEVVFKVKIEAGIAEVIQISSVNITGNLPTSPGIHMLTIQAQSGYVQVTSN